MPDTPSPPPGPRDYHGSKSPQRSIVSIEKWKEKQAGHRRKVVGCRLTVGLWPCTMKASGTRLKARADNLLPLLRDAARRVPMVAVSRLSRIGDGSFGDSLGGRRSRLPAAQLHGGPGNRLQHVRALRNTVVLTVELRRQKAGHKCGFGRCQCHLRSTTRG